MKKAVVSIIILLVFFQIAFAGVSKKQDEKNKTFLKRLDENILSTIEILTTFNEAANHIPNFIKGANKYKTFLMEMTIECSKIRDGIIKSENMNKEEREFQIKELILSIKSDEFFQKERVTKKKDKSNREFLKSKLSELQFAVGIIRKEIMSQEKIIMKSDSISRKYFELHSRNFLYSLLLDYIKISDLLSKENRNYLAEIVRSLETEGAFKPIKN